MNKQTIVSQLKTDKTKTARYGVTAVGLFGSYVRNEQRDDDECLYL